MKFYGGRRLYQYNEDDLIYIKLLNSIDTKKHGNKERLSVKKASLENPCKLVILKEFVNNGNFNKIVVFVILILLPTTVQGVPIDMGIERRL